MPEQAQASFAVIRPAPTSCNYAAVAAGDAVAAAGKEVPGAITGPVNSDDLDAKK
jgi:hypothetical protein